jgi:hypothetical protein
MSEVTLARIGVTPDGRGRFVPDDGAMQLKDA